MGPGGLRGGILDTSDPEGTNGEQTELKKYVFPTSNISNQFGSK